MFLNILSMYKFYAYNVYISPLHLQGIGYSHLPNS